MQIDWLTVAAQIVNFLVLVWLLQRFLYAPITKAMRRREERIEERLAEAKAARQEAEDRERELDEKKAELKESEEAILEDARRKAEELRERLESEIKTEMEEKREAWREHLAEEREGFVNTIRRQAGKQLLEITERVLADYADSDVADRIAGTLAARLDTLDPETRDKLAKAASDSEQPALVETGSDLESAAKGKITRAIHEALSTEIDVEYREDPEMVLGVRLTIGDHHVEWSAKRYLQRLDSELAEIIDAGRRPAGEARETEGAPDAAEDEERQSA